ncbi:MAG: methyltransferase domain-containing protein [Mizugakiibacter sp.]|uniref:class I SAM-dependent methyltransferase n=1 Tax=Mizugakiibacter sp. TaxID=1972610 RepID=UPI0031C58ADA|nr:methyltransferase domain-containing protein [Xanthomonadaceae bacterium]
MPETLAALYATPPLRALCADATAALAPELAGLAGPHALLVDACVAPALPPTPLLATWARLRVDAGALSGDLLGSADALPFADDSFRAVVVRLAAEAIGGPEAIADELARVLAPQGIALIAALHPLSLWQPWLARRAGAALTLALPGRWRGALAARGVDVYAVRRCGAAWPRAETSRSQPRWLHAVGGGYVLIARKRRMATIPLRLRPRSVHVGARAGTLAPGAHRACA